MSPLASKTDPQILEMPNRKMAVISGVGSPDKVFPVAMPALYGSVYTLKFDLKKRGLETFKVEPLRCRYPNAHLVPKDQWTIIMGLPIPDDTLSLPQKVAGTTVRIEVWEYGTVAQILHIGAYDQESANIERLHKFIMDAGYEITGLHEEEYLSRPGARVMKTIIRYPIRKKS